MLCINYVSRIKKSPLKEVYFVRIILWKCFGMHKMANILKKYYFCKQKSTILEKSTFFVLLIFIY